MLSRQQRPMVTLTRVSRGRFWQYTRGVGDLICVSLFVIAVWLLFKWHILYKTYLQVISAFSYPGGTELAAVKRWNFSQPFPLINFTRNLHSHPYCWHGRNFLKSSVNNLRKLDTGSSSTAIQFIFFTSVELFSHTRPIKRCRVIRSFGMQSKDNSIPHIFIIWNKQKYLFRTLLTSFVCLSVCLSVPSLNQSRAST